MPSNQNTPGRDCLQGVHRLGGLGGDLRGVRRPGAEHQLDAGVELVRRGEQVRDALLPGDPADERRDRGVQVDAALDQHGAVEGGLVDLRVDAVVDDVHLGRVEIRVAVEDVGAHAVGHRDDRVGAVVGGRSAQTTPGSRRRAARPSTAGAAPASAR